MSGYTKDEVAFLEGIKHINGNPFKTLSFTKIIYAVSCKTKKQVEDALNLEIKWLEDQNPSYMFKECRQGKPVNDCITFTIVFELVK